MNFLPENYESPKLVSKNYLKLQDGENRVRILSRPIVGWEDWTVDRKPVRFKMDEKPQKSIDPKKPLKHFWAFIVWNVDQEQIQIMQITQATIRSSLEALSKDNDWGSPFEYDIKIFKKGEGKETEYTVNPVPHKPVSQEILQAFKDTPINLNALFVGEDPFWYFEFGITKLMTEEKITPLYISDEQFVELSELKNGCDPKVQVGFDEYLKKAFNIDSLSKLLVKDYESIKQMLATRFKENQKAVVEAEMNDTPEARKKK